MASQQQRYIRPDQIISFTEMKPGFIYVTVNDDHETSCFRLLSKNLSQSEQFSQRMETGTSWNSISGAFLGDHGLEPYPQSGFWNNVNWIRKPTMKELFNFIKSESRAMARSIRKIATDLE